jgi:phosphopantothenoylcysteine decarboxylase/phosphopantothenate--cysteine ligase
MKASTIRCLVSAGPTREFFDPVRYISNPSTGKMGYALAGAAAAVGWHVELVSGPVHIPVPQGVHCTHVVTGQEMFQALHERFAACDILIMTAAILDYRPQQTAPMKVKKRDLRMQVEMDPVPDILASLAGMRRPGQVLVGFAAETDQLERHARDKLESKGADFIIANLVGGESCAFGSDFNSVQVYSHHEEVLQFGPLSKALLAEKLIDHFSRFFTSNL